jgi:putative tricarboxylic transport membrane protein
MDVLDGLTLGFAVSLSLQNLLYCLAGAMIGTAIGILPGLGPTTTIALLLPVTFRLDPIGSIIMLSGIYYGAMYGGSITSILIRIPGEAASVVTCLDGYEMAKRGRAGPALGIAALGSFIAGTAATLGVAMLGPSLAAVALAFGPAEKAMLVLLGLLLVTHVSTGSRSRALVMVVVGLLLGTMGLDPITGEQRFTFGATYLFDGVSIVILAMGLFGVAELLAIALKRESRGDVIARPKKWTETLPTAQDWRDSAAPIARGSLLGFLLGLLPGAGALIASFASYVTEKRLSRSPERFGHGAIEGVAGPEAANNAAAQANFVPLLSLGIPSSVVMGVMMGALMIQGIAPGPALAAQHPELFWGVITSMFLGNLILVLLNVPLIRVFVRLLDVPMTLMAPAIMLFCIVGAYSLNNNWLDVVVMLALGALGFFLRLARFDPAPLVIAFVLGEVFEGSVRQALLISGGEIEVFVSSPLSAGFAIAAALVLALPLGQRLLGRRLAADTSITRPQTGPTGGTTP